MKAFNVSKESSTTLEEKIEAINNYEVGDLLYVLREYEDSPKNFDREVIKRVVEKLYDNGIMCM